MGVHISTSDVSADIDMHILFIEFCLHVKLELQSSSTSP